MVLDRLSLLTPHMLARCQKKTLKLKILKKKEHHQLKTFKKQEIVAMEAAK
jgi:hypothetical protein